MPLMYLTVCYGRPFSSQGRNLGLCRSKDVFHIDFEKTSLKHRVLYNNLCEDFQTSFRREVAVHTVSIQKLDMYAAEGFV